jgi:hypothetical protein
MKAAQENKSQEAEAEAFIASCLQKFANGDLTSKKPTAAANTSSATAASAEILNSILRRAKNKKG